MILCIKIVLCGQPAGIVILAPERGVASRSDDPLTIRAQVFLAGNHPVAVGIDDLRVALLNQTGLPVNTEIGDAPVGTPVGIAVFNAGVAILVQDQLIVLTVVIYGLFLVVSIAGVDDLRVPQLGLQQEISIRTKIFRGDQSPPIVLIGVDLGGISGPGHNRLTVDAIKPLAEKGIFGVRLISLHFGIAVFAEHVVSLRVKELLPLQYQTIIVGIDPFGKQPRRDDVFAVCTEILHHGKLTALIGVHKAMISKRRGFNGLLILVPIGFFKHPTVAAVPGFLDGIPFHSVDQPVIRVVIADAQRPERSVQLADKITVTLIVHDADPVFIHPGLLSQPALLEFIDGFSRRGQGEKDTGNKKDHQGNDTKNSLYILHAMNSLKQNKKNRRNACLVGMQVHSIIYQLKDRIRAIKTMKPKDNQPFIPAGRIETAQRSQCRFHPFARYSSSNKPSCANSLCRLRPSEKVRMTSGLAALFLVSNRCFKGRKTQKTGSSKGRCSTEG